MNYRSAYCAKFRIYNLAHSLTLSIYFTALSIKVASVLLRVRESVVKDLPQLIQVPVQLIFIFICFSVCCLLRHTK